MNIQLLEGRTAEQKRAFAKDIAEAASATLTCSPESVQIIIQYVNKEDWASGGMLWSDKK